MGKLLFKWFIVVTVFSSFGFAKTHHPIFVSVTEIEHNAKDKSLEISCKIFTDDFEKSLRNIYKTHIDLLDAKSKPLMDKFVGDYVQKHLKIKVDGKPVNLRYVGYENIEEAIYSYYQVDNITAVKKVEIADDILYEYKKEQFNLVHVTVGGKRQSTKLNYPERIATMEF
ncbi:MAG: DUF6702 family protein [Ferruginibacter sp.]